MRTTNPVQAVPLEVALALVDRALTTNPRMNNVRVAAARSGAPRPATMTMRTRNPVPAVLLGIAPVLVDRVLRINPRMNNVQVAAVHSGVLRPAKMRMRTRSRAPVEALLEIVLGLVDRALRTRIKTNALAAVPLGIVPVLVGLVLRINPRTNNVQVAAVHSGAPLPAATRMMNHRALVR
jgi:hypothetical protein